MESQLEPISPIECRVKVTIPWKDVSGRLADKLNELQRKVRLPGFRPGKVPRNVVERMFGKGARDELARDLVQETFPNAVGQHSTTPLTQPVVESSSLDKGEAFTYAARFEVPPDIAPKDYAGVAVRRRPVDVDLTKVDADLARRREELAELRPIEAGREETRPADVWTVDVEGVIGKQALSRKDVAIEIGSEKNEYLPGLSAALEGTKLSEVGGVKELRFVPPEDRVLPDFRGEEAVLTVGLREVREKHLPELDDDFARDTGDAETLEELRTKITDGLRQLDSDEAERDARRRLVESLLEHNDFEPAPSMIAREVAAQVEAQKRQLTARGLTLGQLGMNEAQLSQRIRPQAMFNVKAYLLLDSIGKAESIGVTDEEVEKELEELAEEQAQNAARLKASMEKDGQLILLRAQLREEKILDFLMGKADVTEAPDPDVEPSADEAVEQAAKKAADHVGKAEPTRGRKKRGAKSDEPATAEAASDAEGQGGGSEKSPADEASAEESAPSTEESAGD